MSRIDLNNGWLFKPVWSEEFCLGTDSGDGLETVPYIFIYSSVNFCVLSPEVASYSPLNPVTSANPSLSV